MKIVRCIASALIIIGALNWGLVGLFQYDLVANLFGGMSSALARLIYSLVGLAGVYAIIMFCKCGGSGCKCGSGCGCCKK